MAHVVLAKERFESTRSAVYRLNDVKTAIMLEGDDWKPEGVRVRSAKPDPTASRAIYRADELPLVMHNLRQEERELEDYIGQSLKLIHAVRCGIGDKYADILDWIYIDLLSWPQISSLHGVPKSTGCERRNVALDYIDSAGIQALLRGDVEL